MVCLLSKNYFKRKWCVAELLMCIDLYYRNPLQNSIRPLFISTANELVDCSRLYQKLLMFCRDRLAKKVAHKEVPEIKIHPVVVNLEDDQSVASMLAAMANQVSYQIKRKNWKKRVRYS